MKKMWIYLVGLILMWSCEKGVDNTAPYDFQQTIKEVQLLSATDNGNGFTTYKYLLPYVWETGLNEKWDGVGIQINNGSIVPLYAAQNQNAYYWEYTTSNDDIFINFGHFRDNNGEITWANEVGMKQSNYYIESAGKKYIGITFRDGKSNPIVPASLTKLEAIIDINPTEVMAGSEVTLSGSRSTAQASPTSQILEYLWDFGDGSGAVNQMIVKHVYKIAGSYTVSLIVKDNFYNSDTAWVKIEVGEMAHPGEFGDDFLRFSFNFQSKVVRIYHNFSRVVGVNLGKPNVYGNFNGPDQAWKLFDAEWGLKFDTHHVGWGYIELPMTAPIMTIKEGFSSWYDGTKEQPDFSNANFDHLKNCFYYNGQDLSFIIYSSGQIFKGP